MASILEMAKRLAKVEDKLPQIANVAMDDVVNENEEVFLEMNRNQLLKGKTSENKQIRPKYKNKSYANKKQRMNSQPSFGVPDLRLSGVTFNEMVMEESSAGEYQWLSKSKQWKWLKGKYGEGIGGINNKNRGIFVQKYFYPAFMEIFKEQLRIL